MPQDSRAIFTYARGDGRIPPHLDSLRRKTMNLHAKKTCLPYVLIIVILLLGEWFGIAAPPVKANGIVIDGVKEAAWGDALASDPAGDMSEPNLDLQDLYVLEDADNYYIGFDATASNWGMTYGIYIDSDQVDGSGATSDPWGRAVSAVSAHLPEHTLYVWHEDWDALQDVQLNQWDGSGWSYDSLISQGGEQGYGPGDDWIEYRVPKLALGSPSCIALEVFTTGGSGHAQDSVPGDPNVAYPDPDWGGDVTTLSAFVLFPPPAWYVRGDFNGWGLSDPLYDDGAHGDVAAGDGIYTALVSISVAGRYEFKVASGDWSVSYPPSGNSWLDTTAADEVVTITLDTNTYGDGWEPATNVIGVSTEPGTWTAVGDWQGWNPANPATAMTPLGGGGQYQLTYAVASPGTYQFKAVKTATWDAVGLDGRSVNANTVTFETTVADQNVTFSADALAGRVRVEVEPVPPTPGPDDDIWWGGLGHNSRDSLYRVPWGAVTTGTPVTLRLRTFHDDVTDVTLRVWTTEAGAQTLYPMELVATTDDPPYGYDYWQASIPPQADPTILYYRFIIRDGSDEDFYEDDGLFDGGWGTAYDDSPDYSFQIDVYQPDFETPDWMKDAVVYQIFPDRFYNGAPKKDPEPTDPTVYGNPVLKKAWDDLPEGYCRTYESVPCAEEPLGRDFFGGDLKGVLEKLDYLHSLGVTAIYFNPIFKAPSNHLYDTTNYFRVDPYFGSAGTGRKLRNKAQELGIRIILDGVFNHTSSDSWYFDRYSRYDTLGAYESQDSPYYDWYTFYDWPDDYNSWWGFDTLPVLTEIQEVRDFIYGDSRSVARWWIKLGASGWRLDVAPDKSHEWWQEFRPRVKSVNPDAVILGEIWDDASPWILGNEFDSTMNYRFRRALIGFVNGDTNDPNQGFIRGLNPDQFNSILLSIKEDYPPPAFEAAMNLVGTHDTQRILWVLTPGARNRDEKEFNSANLAEGKAKLQLLAIIQMTLPGAPTIYYGDEVGLTGDTDPDDRRPFPWGNEDMVLLDHYTALIHLRHEHSFLRTGSLDHLYTHNDDGTYAYGRKDTSGAAVVALNQDTAAHDLAIDLSGYVPEGTVLTDALNGGTHTVTDGQITVGVGGRWGAILLTPPGTDLTPPDAPTGLTAMAGDGYVELAWNAVPGAAGYHVYRSPVTGGGYTLLNDIPVVDTAYPDDMVVNGRLYYYVVTAVDAAGNESGYSNEVEALPHLIIGWANLQWPPNIVHTISALAPTENIYGQVWIDGYTSLPGPPEGLMAEVGYGPDGSDPDGNPDWIWAHAEFNVDAGNNDEFRGQLVPEAVGVYDYAYRYTTTAGRMWVYADLDGIGNGYDPAQAGDLTVNPSADTTPPSAPANLHVTEASPSFIALAWDAVPDADLYRYEVYRGDAIGGPYVKMANVMAPATEYTDWNVASGSTYYYVVLATDTSFNTSGDSNEVEGTAQARPVQVTFNATLPDTTPDGDDIYIGGDFNGWDPAGTLMARTDLFATVPLTFYEGDTLEYKYTRGSWTYVEKDAACGEVSNRIATIVYGTDGTMTLEDTVLNWRNTGLCGD
jgi:glycosidase